MNWKFLLYRACALEFDKNLDHFTYLMENKLVFKKHKNRCISYVRKDIHYFNNFLKYQSSSHKLFIIKRYCGKTGASSYDKI